MTNNLNEDDDILMLLPLLDTPNLDFPVSTTYTYLEGTGFGPYLRVSSRNAIVTVIGKRNGDIPVSADHLLITTRRPRVSGIVKLDKAHRPLFIFNDAGGRIDFGYEGNGRTRFTVTSPDGNVVTDHADPSEDGATVAASSASLLQRAYPLDEQIDSYEYGLASSRLKASSSSTRQKSVMSVKVTVNQQPCSYATVFFMPMGGVPLFGVEDPKGSGIYKHEAHVSEAEQRVRTRLEKPLRKATQKVLKKTSATVRAIRHAGGNRQLCGAHPASAIMCTWALTVFRLIELMDPALAENTKRFSKITASTLGYFLESPSVRPLVVVLNESKKLSPKRVSFVIPNRYAWPTTNFSIPSIVVIDDDFHHLGDGSFQGDVNDSLETRTPSGTSFSTTFKLTEEQVGLAAAKVRINILVKGAQGSRVLVNGTSIGSLNNKDYFAETISLRFKKNLLKIGQNRVKISSKISDEDYDDFEFEDVRLFLI